MSETRIRFYEFGPFRLDVAERQLWRNGDEITVTPKTFGVLLTLVRNHGHIVEKETFMREVWAESFVEEKNLTDNISILRQTLVDDPKKPRYIKTVPRRGYRFVGNVNEVRDRDLEMVVAERTRASLIIEETSDAPATTISHARQAPPARLGLVPSTPESPGVDRSRLRRNRGCGRGGLEGLSARFIARRSAPDH